MIQRGAVEIESDRDQKKDRVMGVLLSALFLGEGREAFSLTGILALLLVSAGVVIVNTAEKE